LVLLTELRRVAVDDARGRRARLLDLTIDLSADVHPPVTGLLLRGRDGPVGLPWSAVTRADWPARRLTVADLAAAGPVDRGELSGATWLERDVLDAMVIDLRRRQAMRADDLWLEEAGGRLRLQGVELGARAVVRRLARGLLGGGAGPTLLDWGDVLFLRGDPGAPALSRGCGEQVARLPAAAIAHLADALPYLHAAELLTALPDPLAADVLEATGPERQVQVVDELAEERVVRLLALMAPDVAADLVGRLDPEQAKRHLDRLPAPHGERILDLLRYPEDTAGGIMTNDAVVAAADLTIAAARRALRDHLREPDFIYFVYVVDDERSRVLRGVITLRDLLVGDDDARLAELMRQPVVTIQPLEPAARAARLVIDSHLAALPVVAPDGRLLGAVTVDAAVAQVAPRSWGSQAPRVFS
jgi:CBS domain-containing protein